MKTKTAISFIVIFTMMVNFTIMTARGEEESQTIKITLDFDDGFITETGAHFPGQTLVTILDPNMDIHSYLVFRLVEINSFESLTNATLRLRTASSLPFDADSTITIYGVKDGEFPGFSSPSAVPSYPLTFAHVDYNTSQFYGSSWKEIDVTNIVEELKSSPSWEGDEAISGTFGFIIEGAEGHDPRWFYDLGAGNGLEAQLVIWWGAEAEEPPPDEKPPDYNGTDFVWEYVNTTIAYDPGDNETAPWEGEVEIWLVTESDRWLNFSTFTQYGAQDKMTGENETFFQLTNFYQDSDDYYRRNFSDDGSGLVHVKFGMTWESLPWAGATNGYAGVYGISDIHTFGEAWTNGYRYTARVRHDEVAGNIRTRPLDSETWFSNKPESGLPFTLWYDIEINMKAQYVNTTVYNDWEMTSLNESLSYTMGAGPVYSEGLFEYEYIFFRNYASADNTGFTAKFHSKIGVEDLDEFYFLVWPNGTVIGGPYDTEEDALTDLDDLLGVNPLDPEPPSQGWDPTGPFTRFKTRLYIFLMGAGMLWGPLMVFAYRRPTGYAFVIGLFVMLIGLGFLIHAGTV